MFSCLTASPKKKVSKKLQRYSTDAAPDLLPQDSKISTRKLLARLLPQPSAPADDSAATAASDADGDAGGCGSEGDLRGQLHALLKYLHGERLAKLATAVEVGTAGCTECVRLEPGGPASTELRLGRHRVNARVLCLRAWRLPDLPAAGAAVDVTPLTEVCCCPEAGQCINPFHFYRTVAAAPDLQCLLDRFNQLEVKLPAPSSSVIGLSDNDVSSSGCSSDSLLSGRKSWLTTTSGGSSSSNGSASAAAPGAGCYQSACNCSCCSCSGGSSNSTSSSYCSCSVVATDLLSIGGSASSSSSCCCCRHRDSADEDPPLAPVAAPTSWCALAYWEGRSRVGQLVHVRDPAFHVFQRRPLSNGLSLEALASGPAGRQPSLDPDGELARQATKTRSKIGAGVTLVRRLRRCCGPGGCHCRRTELLIFNQSEHAVFVHSPTLQPLLLGGADSSPYQAVKLPPHSCLKAFDSAAAGLLSRARQLGLSASLNQCAAADPFTVRLSFVKGFGAAYQRQDIIYCPCWLEVMLSLT